MPPNPAWKKSRDEYLKGEADKLRTVDRLQNMLKDVVPPKEEFRVDWEPLRFFLDKYGVLGADKELPGWMYMGSYPSQDGITIYEYKHGITRKGLALDADGNSYRADYSQEPTRYSPDPLYAGWGPNKRVPYRYALHYQAAEEMVPTGEHRRKFQQMPKENRPPMTAEEILSTPYDSNYKARRNKALVDAGYTVLGAEPGGSTKTEPENLSHYDQVKDAMARGEEVPPEAKKDYPDLLKESVEKIIVFHGSKEDFDTFERKTSSNLWSMGSFEADRNGFFFTDNYAFAKEFGNIVYRCEITLVDPVEMDRDIVLDFAETLDSREERDLWLQAKYSQSFWSLFDNELGKRFVSYLQNQGYDSAYFQEEEGMTYVVFDPDRITILEKNISESLEDKLPRNFYQDAPKRRKSDEPREFRYEYEIYHPDAESHSPFGDGGYSTTTGAWHKIKVPPDMEEGDWQDFLYDKGYQFRKRPRIEYPLPKETDEEEPVVSREFLPTDRYAGAPRRRKDRSARRESEYEVLYPNSVRINRTENGKYWYDQGSWHRTTIPDDMTEMDWIQHMQDTGHSVRRVDPFHYPEPSKEKTSPKLANKVLRLAAEERPGDES